MDAENETYAEFKKRRSASFGVSGMGQKKREGTGKKNLSELRRKLYKEQITNASGRIVIPRNGLEMAHLRAKGMGGRDRLLSDDPMNVCMLCKEHHDIFDGRQRQGSKREYTNLLKGFFGIKMAT